MNVLIDLWPIGVFVISVIVWLIRLESKVLSMEKDLDKHKDNDKDSRNKIDEQLHEIRLSMTQVLQALSKIEGKLEAQEKWNLKTQ